MHFIVALFQELIVMLLVVGSSGLAFPLLKLTAQLFICLVGLLWLRLLVLALVSISLIMVLLLLCLLLVKVIQVLLCE